MTDNGGFDVSLQYNNQLDLGLRVAAIAALAGCGAAQDNTTTTATTTTAANAASSINGEHYSGRRQ